MPVRDGMNFVSLWDRCAVLDGSPHHRAVERASTALEEKLRMKCPVDDAELRITDRQGVEVDYCPVCRGVWLDRGELDKILQRAARDDDRDDDDRASRSRDRDDRTYRDTPRYDDRDYRGDEAPRRKRRRSLLEDLFDFD